MTQVCVYIVLYFLICPLKSLDNILIRSNNVYKSIIKDINDYYQCRSITLLYATSDILVSAGAEKSMEFMELQLFFSNKYLIPTRIADIQKSSLDVVKNIDIMMNPFFVILNDSDDVEIALPMLFTQVEDISRVTWLIFFSNETVINDFFTNTYIPINCKFMVSKKDFNTENREIITEIYQFGVGAELNQKIFGIWNFDTGLLPPKLSFYQRRNNFYGYPLRISATGARTEKVKINSPSTNETIHEVIVHPTNDEDRMNFLITEFGQIINIFSDKLNFSANITLEETKHSHCHDDACTGYMYNLWKGNVDAYGEPYAMVIDNVDFIDATLNFYVEIDYLCIKKPPPSAGWNEIFKPFEVSIWLVIISLIIIGTFILILTMTIIHEITYKPQKWIRQQLKLSALNITENYFSVFGIFCNQGMQGSYSTPIRVIQATIHITALLVLTAYSAELIRFLATSPYHIPFTSVEDFLDDGSYSLGLRITSPNHEEFEHSENELEQRISQALEKESSMPNDDWEGLQQMCNSEKYGFIACDSSLEDYVFKLNCTPIIIGPANEDPVGIGLPKKSPIRKIFNIQVLHMIENGLFEKVQDEKPINREDITKSDLYPVDIIHILPLIVFLVVIAGVSVIILLGEIIIDRKLKNYNY